MPLDPGELRRGRIVWAIYPFASQFPAEILTADGRAPVESIEQYARLRGGRSTALATEVRLRSILLLHDGTRGDHGDIACLRINTVKPRHRRHNSWPKIERREHPFFFHLPRTERYGLPEESVISLTSIGTVHKSAIAALNPPGSLSLEEMQFISEGLGGAVSLDLAPQIARRARALLERAGVIDS